MAFTISNPVSTTVLICSQTVEITPTIKSQTPTNISFTPSQILAQSPLKIPSRILSTPVITSTINLNLEIIIWILVKKKVPIRSIIGAITGNTLSAKKLRNGTNTFSHNFFSISKTVPNRLPTLSIAGLI